MVRRTIDQQLRDVLGPQITEEELLEQITFERVIGNGATAKVYEALDRKSGERVAIKVFDKAQMIETRQSILGDEYVSRETAVARAQRRLKKIITELEITQALDHANVIRFLGGYETSHRICIVHELVDGHDLLDYVLTYQKMEEALAAHVFEQLLRAIQACHDLNIWHRDLKLENVLITREFHVKLIDFGLSERTLSRLSSVCGTPLYCSPELLFLPTNTRDDGVWGGPADVWSAAILLFALLTGCAPYNDSSFVTLRQDIYKNEIAYPDHLSESVQDLLRSVLVSDPEARPTVVDLLQHPWVVKNSTSYRSSVSSKSPRIIFRAASGNSETEDSSDNGSFDESNSYRDLLYDELVDQTSLVATD
ncbi:hypothetical protein LEN26_008420 [Aphanomyces euteiches]|nr:hypothetical protein LEN26_008420 [Aphanomyces euteiches]